MEQVFKCVVCSEEFESLEKLNVHTERQHERVQACTKKNSNCNICGFKCSFESDLIKHTRTHTGERPFKCKFADCTMAFKQKSHLTNHIKSKHNDERPFKCEAADCKMAFKHKSHLNSHIKYKHSDGRPLKCEFPDCRYTTKKSSNLSDHKKIHSAERPYACPNDGCSFQAKRKAHIVRHIKCAHNQTKAFACTKCDYRTARRDDLKSHMRRHSAKTDFKCSYPECTESFKTSKSLKGHLCQLHEEPIILSDRTGCGQYGTTTQALKDNLKLRNPSSRPIQCPLCFKHFRTLWQMQEHFFVHTNEKPFQCGQCNYEAASRSHVKRHISLAHANIQFPVIVHLLDDRECLHCKVILPSAEFLIHSQSHEDPAAKT